MMYGKFLIPVGLLLLIAVSLGTATSVQAAPEYEKELVIYSPHGAEMVDPVLARFKARYPDIKVDVVKAGTGVLMSRIAAEKERPLGDVMWGGTSSLFEASAHLFKAYESPTDAAFVKIDPAHKWHAFTTIPKCISINTDLVKPADYPKRITDLADPKWFGKYVFVNPRYSGTGYAIYLSVYSKYGENHWIEHLANCTIVGSSDAMFAAVKDGEFAVGWINEGLGVRWMGEGAPLHLVYPEDGVPWEFDCIGIIKDGPHPEAAKLFLDFVQSKETHELIVAETLRRSLRKDVAAPGGLTPTEELDFIEYDEAWAAKKDDRLKEFDMMIGKAATVAAGRIKPGYSLTHLAIVAVIAIIAALLVSRVVRKAGTR